jgi:hypothetical protein
MQKDDLALGSHNRWTVAGTAVNGQQVSAATADPAKIIVPSPWRQPFVSEPVSFAHRLRVDDARGAVIVVVPSPGDAVFLLPIPPEHAKDAAR